MNTFQYGQDQLTVGTALQLARKEIKGELSAETLDKVQASALAVSNIAKGEKAYADYAALKAANGGDQDEDAPPKEVDREIHPKEDPYLMEAGHVLADFINQLKSPEKKVATQ